MKISNFLSLKTLKNGNVKIQYNINDEANLYRCLYSLGFRIKKIDGKYKYLYHNAVVPFHYLFNEFLSSIEDERIENDLSDRASINEIKNFFLGNNIIKRNNLLKVILKGEY